MSISVEALCKPISEELPSGENLEYDPEYLEMENLFQEKGESSIEVEGQEDSGPDWKGVQRLANSLAKRTRDLHVQVYATIASIHTGGIPDFRDNLKVLLVYLREFWDTVHPQLDPDDDNDPMLRLNTMQMLNDFNLITKALDQVKLVELKGMGKFGVREIELSQGKVSPSGDEEVTDLNIIREAFNQSGGEFFDSLVEATAESIQLLSDMDAAWKEMANDPQGLLYDNATSSLKKVSQILFEFAPSGSTAVQEAQVEESGSAGGGGASGPAVAVSGTVNSRADVVRLLDNICEYYERNEPSSPMPVLLRRARGLVEKSFMEILEDMVPDGLSQAKVVAGIKDDGY
jgi:type VI secretion system protein ImpA